MTRSHLFVALIAIILLGFGLRVHNLGAAPLRGDEAFSALFWADLPLSQSLAEIAALDPHPPLAFALFRFWRFLISGVEPAFALRYLSVLGNVIGIAGMFALAWLLSGRLTAGFLAGLIWALHPFEIWHSQDFRNYAVWAGLSVTAMWLGLRVIDGGRRSDFRAYATAATAAALFFYTELFMMLALAAIAILKRRNDRQFLKRFLGLQAGIVALALLAFLILQARPVLGGSYGGTLQGFAASDYVTRFLPALFLGETLPLDSRLAGLILLGICLIAAGLTWRASTREFAFIFIIALLPLVLIGLASQRLNVFNPRYVLASVPAYILILAVLSLRIAHRLKNRIKTRPGVLALALLLPWFAAAAVSIHAHFEDPRFRKAPAWDALGEFLSARVSADDFVIQQSVDPAFAYYYRGAAPETALPAHPEQPQEEIITELERLTESAASVYVVSSAQAGWPNADVVLDWMRENRQEVLDTDVFGLPARQYMPWTVADQFEGELARFADLVALVDYEFSSEPLPNGDLLLWVYWRPLGRAERPLKSFAHVYGGLNPETGGILWAQDDPLPQAGRLDARRWPVDDVYRDVYYLPTAALVDGEYSIHVGWYEAESASRLELPDGSDSYRLLDFRLAQRAVAFMP